MLRNKLSYQQRRASRKAIVYREMYGGTGQIRAARAEGSYPPTLTVDLADIERRLLAGRDPFGEDS